MTNSHKFLTRIKMPLYGDPGSKVDKSTVSIQENGQLLTTNSAIANAFSSHFSSITECDMPRTRTRKLYFYRLWSSSKHFQILNHWGGGCETRITLTECKQGHRTQWNINPAFKANCSFLLTYSLTLLFNHSLQAGSFPDEWKLANVIPVPKSGDKQLLQNHALSYFGDPSCCESVRDTSTHASNYSYNYLNMNGLLI